MKIDELRAELPEDRGCQIRQAVRVLLDIAAAAADNHDEECNRTADVLCACTCDWEDPIREALARLDAIGQGGTDED